MQQITAPHSFFSSMLFPSSLQGERASQKMGPEESQVLSCTPTPTTAVVIGRLVGLGLLWDGAGLATLPAAHLLDSFYQGLN